MAKKKSASKRAAAAKKKPSPLQAKKATATSRNKKPAAATKSAGPKSAKRKSAKPSEPSIGRALVSADEKLYMLFKEDYHARQVFEFLRVETVRDLEQFSPEQIVKLLSQPVRSTVDRIRQKLADKNRCLAGDEQHAAELKRKQAEAK